MLNENEKAPDFTLSDVRGGTITLSEILKSKHVALVFYRGGWCPLCNRQLAELSNNYESFTTKDIEIIAVSNDKLKSGKKLLKKIGSPFPILYDVESEILALYRSVISGKRDPLGWMLRKKQYASPSVFLIDKQQIIHWIYKGKDYTDRPSSHQILEAATTLDE